MNLTPRSSHRTPTTEKPQKPIGRRLFFAVISITVISTAVLLALSLSNLPTETFGYAPHVLILLLFSTTVASSLAITKVIPWSSRSLRDWQRPQVLGTFVALLIGALGLAVGLMTVFSPPAATERTLEDIRQGLIRAGILPPHVSATTSVAPGKSSTSEPTRPNGWPRVVLPGSQINSQTVSGTFFQDCLDCPLMVVVPAGNFFMGADSDDPNAKPSELPRREVVLSRPFAASVYETTFREWESGVRAGRLARAPNPTGGVASDRGWGRGLRPVIEITFDEANAYVQWLNELIDGAPYRLPSEAEWEYVARAGATTRYTFGNDYRSDMVSGGDSGTLPVGSFAANRFGLRDVQGNVWEWTADCWHDNYVGAPSHGTAWITNGDCSTHSLRGGSWGRVPSEMRLSNRFAGRSGGRRLGFRVVRDLR